MIDRLTLVRLGAKGTKVRIFKKLDIELIRRVRCQASHGIGNGRAGRGPGCFGILHASPTHASHAAFDDVIGDACGRIQSHIEGGLVGGHPSHRIRGIDWQRLEIHADSTAVVIAGAAVHGLDSG